MMGMTEPEPFDSYAAILAELLSLYPALPKLTLKASHRRVTHIAHGWYVRAHRGSEAVLVLRDLGFAAESWPTRRSVLEHVVGLKWLAAEGGRAVDPLVRELAEQARRRQLGAEAAGWKAAGHSGFVDAMADGQAAEDDVDLDTYLHFKHRCNAYGNPHDWSSWLIETAHSHPGWETAAPYLDRLSQTLLLEPRRTDRDDEGYLAIHVWEALSALSSMMQSPPWEHELLDAYERILAQP